MKILHCCLAAFYIDNYGYQENHLTRCHKIQGHDVRILASTETFLKNKTTGYLKPIKYFNEDDILVTRLAYSPYLPKLLVRKLRIYIGVYNAIVNFHPDIIFIHNPQFLSILTILKYVKKNKVKVYIDSHVDRINSAKTWLSFQVLHKLIYKYLCVRRSIKYVEKYYGTLPVRVDFLVDVYGVPRDKVDFLPMGVDDINIDFSNRKEIRKNIRQQLHLSENDFVIITGGKIDKLKNIHLLVEAIAEINHNTVKLIIFGTPVPDMMEYINSISDNRIINIGWINFQNTYQYYFASDLAFFPGTHSTLWEEAVGAGIPCVFKYWDGIDHVNRNQNCLFIKNPTVDLVKEMIIYLFDNIDVFENLKWNALSQKTIQYFSYSYISKRAIEL